MQLDGDFYKNSQCIEHIVVFFCNGIGDAFMSLPTLRALRKKFNKKLNRKMHISTHHEH